MHKFRKSSYKNAENTVAGDVNTKANESAPVKNAPTPNTPAQNNPAKKITDNSEIAKNQTVDHAGANATTEKQPDVSTKNAHIPQKKKTSKDGKIGKAKMSKRQKRLLDEVDKLLSLKFEKVERLLKGGMDDLCKKADLINSGINELSKKTDHVLKIFSNHNEDKKVMDNDAAHMIEELQSQVRQYQTFLEEYKKVIAVAVGIEESPARDILLERLRRSESMNSTIQQIDKVCDSVGNCSKNEELQSQVNCIKSLLNQYHAKTERK